MHDYDSEPGISYTVSKLLLYERSSHSCEGSLRLKSRSDVGFGCSTRFSPAFHPRCIGASFVVAAYFASCADYLTTVSSGMISELLNSNPALANLILDLTQEQRIIPIRNWVSDAVWDDARKIIPLTKPKEAKLRAKMRVADLYSELRQRGKRFHEKLPGMCFVGWMGRFEENKGVNFLPAIMRSSCQVGCAFVTMGYSTNRNHVKHFDKILRKLEALAEEMECPLLVARSKSAQLGRGELLRAALDVVVVPSLREAFGLVAAEGLAFASIPVVSSVGGLPEVISPVHKFRNWTGLEFPLFPHSEKLTSKAVSAAVSEAILLYRQALECENLDGLLQRLILSTPLKHHTSNSKLTYDWLYRTSAKINRTLASGCSAAQGLATQI